MQKHYEEKGYLHENFKIFYLEGMSEREIQYHYHSFDKIIFFFDGKVEYTIEGKSYDLLPNDIVMVPRGDSHKVKATSDYTRLVIYLSPDYIDDFTDGDFSLRSCLEQAEKQHVHVFRFKEKVEHQLVRLALELRNVLREKDQNHFGNLYQQTLLLQFLIGLNQKMENQSMHYVDTSNCHQKIVEIIHYINNHLTEDISIDNLSEIFYISKYYMMRQFKAETGYTIGNYLTQKRLFLAREYITQGANVTEACMNAGFRDYSTFSRAYKQLFSEPPSKLKIK